MLSPVNAYIPEFGVVVQGSAYHLRPGAYGVLQDAAGRVAVMMTPAGGFFPGGGQEPGESLQQTLQREFVEESGLHVQLGRQIGVADELVHSVEEGRYFRKRGTFYEVLQVGQSGSSDTEPDHYVTWLPASEAILVLSHESHRWALRTLLAEPVASLNGGPAR